MKWKRCPGHQPALNFALDMVQDTWRMSSKPGLTLQLLQALKLRIALTDGEEDRNTAEELIRKLLTQGKKERRDQLIREAWGLPEPKRVKPQKWEAVISNTAPSTSAASAVPMDAWANRRTLQHLVDLVYQEEELPEPTSLDVLLRKEAPEAVFCGDRVVSPDRECHIVVNNENWLGEFVVWSHPVMQPWDVQVWTSKRLPTYAQKVATNCLYCSRKGSGAVSIRGADYDGDKFSWSNNPLLLRLVKMTAEGIAVPELQAATKSARHRIAKQRKHILQSMQQYREYVLSVDTQPVRGLVCAIAERLQQAVFASPDPRRDGMLFRAIEGGACSEAANDSPKKYPPSAVIEVALDLLKAAGLKRNAERSSKALAQLLKLPLGDPFVDLDAMLSKSGAARLGQIWVPQPDINLSAEAGTALRELTLLSVRQFETAISKTFTRQQRREDGVEDPSIPCCLDLFCVEPGLENLRRMGGPSPAFVFDQLNELRAEMTRGYIALSLFDGIGAAPAILEDCGMLFRHLGDIVTGDALLHSGELGKSPMVYEDEAFVSGGALPPETLPAAPLCVELLLLDEAALGVQRGRLFDSSGGVLDTSTPVKRARLQNGDSLIYHLSRVQVRGGQRAFAAILGDGTVVTWGEPESGGDSSAVQDRLKNVHQIQANDSAFAAILGDGSVVTWGRPGMGGDSEAVQHQLKKVQQIQASDGAFAAVLGDGSVVAWGYERAGSDCRAVQEQLKNVQQIHASRSAFAAILDDGSVVTWGHDGFGGDSSAVQDQLKNVQQIQASRGAFAAILSDGSAVTWGNAAFGGNSSAVQDQLQNVQQIQATDVSFAAILGDGSVVTWGNAECGGDSSAVQHQLKNVQQVQAIDFAFAAILGNGSVVTWGVAGYGGDSSAVQDQLKDVQQVQATCNAFAAILGDGSVVTWGHDGFGGDSSAVQGQLKNVQQIQANGFAFAAIRSDGSVVTWGDAHHGGDSSSVQAQLRMFKASLRGFTKQWVVGAGRSSAKGLVANLHRQLEDSTSHLCRKSAFGSLVSRGAHVRVLGYEQVASQHKVRRAEPSWDVEPTVTWSRPGVVPSRGSREEPPVAKAALPRLAVPRPSAGPLTLPTDGLGLLSALLSWVPSCGSTSLCRSSSIETIRGCDVLLPEAQPSWAQVSESWPLCVPEVYVAFLSTARNKASGDVSSPSTGADAMDLQANGLQFEDRGASGYARVTEHAVCHLALAVPELDDDELVLLRPAALKSAPASSGSRTPSTAATRAEALLWPGPGRLLCRREGISRVRSLRSAEVGQLATPWPHVVEMNCSPQSVDGPLHVLVAFPCAKVAADDSRPRGAVRCELRINARVELDSTLARQNCIAVVRRGICEACHVNAERVLIQRLWSEPITSATGPTSSRSEAPRRFSAEIPTECAGDA
ncbi:putative E3 ubiquitin-protein ligase HERC1 [Symbiodinium microadriaticum]|uniref:Putative E3 ubiquitin-protein ligase HERC1 n=1 Tax=Symbiodinium microadriaticum TaxID=2951 RepID=A0A1Q9EGM8_SYMMI|nr:putative E3 ubiquitin-protein ligase HERC1 [Symbiodinium microadriaticum]